jgi:carbonic anhydrase
VDQLIAGYRRFRAGHWQSHHKHYESLREGQAPHVCVISCCDSRVDPMSIFDAQAGDLFVIRNVANLVPPYSTDDGLHGTSTAIEFAVRTLKVETILVLGHARCGGVAAAIGEGPPEDAVFLKQWISLLNDAKLRVGDHDADALEHASIKVSLERLMTFPFVAEAVNAKRLSLAGARFSVFEGRL